MTRPIQIQEFGIYLAAFTNEFLLMHAETIPELFLESAEEYRFLTELKRFVRNPGIINQESRSIGFAFENHQVLFREGKIKLIRKGRIVDEQDVQAFVRHPNAVFRGMMKTIRGGQAQN